MKALKSAVGLIIFGAGLAHSFDFKGLELGATTTIEAVENALKFCGPTSVHTSCALIKEAANVKCGEGANGWKVCNGLTSVAGNTGRVNLVINEHSVIQRLHITEISSSAFDDIGKQLKVEFGRPASKRRSIVQNGYGAKFEQTEIVWRNAKNHRVELIDYAGSIDSASVYFSIPEDRQQNRPARKKGAL